MWILNLWFLLLTSRFVKSVDVRVQILDPTGSILAPEFLSLGLDSAMIREHWCHINWTRTIELSKVLTPAFLRFGGNDADRLRFKNGSARRDFNDCRPHDRPKTSNFTMTLEDWKLLNWFSRKAGLKLIFDFNLLVRDKRNRWDPTDARKLLTLSDKLGYQLGFELGNEPNNFKRYHNLLSGRQIGKDYIRLRGVLQEFPRYQSSVLIGPSISQPNHLKRVKLLKQFLGSGASRVITAVSFHQYYVNGRMAKEADFLNATILDTLAPEMKLMMTLARKFGVDDVWLGETASAFGGGAPGLSDSFIAGFMWLDKLGLAARLGVGVVVRQSLYRGSYALIDPNMNPNPDFWLSLLFKRLVGPRVLRVRFTVSEKSYGESIRLYAHSNGINITVFGMNLGVGSVRVWVPTPGAVEQYILSPGEERNLTSRGVRLNGKLLRLAGVWPSLDPLPVRPPVSVPPHSLFFIVFPLR